MDRQQENVNRLGKSAPQTFTKVRDQRENGAITRVSSSPFSYVSMKFFMVSREDRDWCPTQASRNGGAHVFDRVNSRGASDLESTSTQINKS